MTVMAVSACEVSQFITWAVKYRTQLVIRII